MIRNTSLGGKSFLCFLRFLSFLGADSGFIAELLALAVIFYVFDLGRSKLSHLDKIVKIGFERCSVLVSSP
jgi:hypothetical protein